LGAFRPLADLLPDPMLLVRPEGGIEDANRAFISAFGWRRTDVEHASLAELTAVSPDALAEFLRHSAATGQFLPGALAVRRRDGTIVSCRAEGALFRPGPEAPRLLVVRLVPQESAVAHFLDLTQKIGDLSGEVTRRRRAEEAAAEALERERRVRERLTALAEASGTLVASLAVQDVLPAIGALACRLIPADAHAVWHCDTEAGHWRVVWQWQLSPAFVTAVAGSGLGTAPAPVTEPLFVERVDAVPLLADRWSAYAREGIRSLVLIPLRVGSGTFGTVVAYYRQPMSIGIDDRRVATALCNIASSALTMATLYEAESANRVAALASERRAGFLANASAALASSLDYEETLSTVAHLAVPEIADWCAVDIAEGETLKRLAIAHQDPTKIDLARRFHERYPPDPASPYGIAEAMRTARPILMSNIPEDLIAASARDAEHLELIRALGLRSYMCVPLVVRGRALGVLTFVSSESGRQYGESDLRLAEEVASRAALAVENAHAYDEARQANRLKDEFLATLSHELRTPLNAVLGYARMLRSGVLTTEKRANAIEVLERNAVALNQIVEDVLDVSRIVAGKIRLQVQPVDLSVVLHDAAATVSPAAEARGVRLETHLDPLSATVSGDSDRLQQVVWNLLSNAVKFTPRGGRVELRLEPCESQIQIVVSDTGIGINPEFLPYVFERFRQADSGFSRQHGGLGLGLAIARHIVEMHGGTIAASSAGSGRGAAFIVRLPIMAVQQPLPLPGRPAATGERSAAVMAADGLEKQLNGLHVLAVDDDADALMLVAEILESAGAQVSVANSGAAAMDRLGDLERLPNIVLTDLGMPGMDGFELIQQIRSSRHSDIRDLPAVALTAYARSEDRMRALHHGYQMHLAKPISPAELVAAIRSVASRRGPTEPQV
jgi:signal transduction histidine kinase/PAS domain-containing protein/ActR/RegA family two-component response regulator